MSDNSDDRVNEWTDIENVKTMYRYMKADRDGWSKMYWKEELTSFKLTWAVILMAIPTIDGVINGVLWIYHHVQVHFA